MGGKRVFVMKGLEGGAVVNDSLNGFQSRGVTDQVLLPAPNKHCNYDTKQYRKSGAYFY